MKPVPAARLGDEHAIGAELDHGELSTHGQQGVGGRLGIAVPTAASASDRFPTTTVGVTEGPP